MRERQHIVKDGNEGIAENEERERKMVRERREEPINEKMRREGQSVRHGNVGMGEEQ